MDRILNVLALTFMFLLAAWASLTLAGEFLGSDFQEQYASIRPPSPTFQATSLDAIANRVCKVQTDVLVVYYYKADDPQFKDQNRILEIINRHFEHDKVDVVRVDLAKLPADQRPHADTSIDVLAFNWRADGAGMTSAEGPGNPGWQTNPQPYREVRRVVDSELSRVAQTRHFADPKAQTIDTSQCSDTVKSMLEWPAHH